MKDNYDVKNMKKKTKKKTKNYVVNLVGKQGLGKTNSIDDEMEKEYDFKNMKTRTQVEKERAEANSFKKGDKVIKQLFFFGQKTEANEYKVHSVKDGVVYLADDYGDKISGVIYNTKGEEIENVFLPHTHSTITKVK